MKKYIIPILVISLIGIFGNIYYVQAGFGVSPPYLNNNKLKPGSRFESTIYLVRGQPTEESIAEVTIDAPEIEQWITIEKGLRFPLPKGVQQFPMKVTVDVPSDAAYGNYQGYIRVRVVSSGQEPGQVTTLLGGRIDISLTVTEKGFTDFRITGNPFIPDVEKGEPLSVFIQIENTGNTQVRPSKVHVDIYDISLQNLLISGDVGEMNWVAAFESKQVEGQMPVDLELGEYWAEISVYKEEEKLGPYRIYFKVVPKIEKPEIFSGNGEKLFLKLYLPYIAAGIAVLIILLVLNRTASKSKKNFKEKKEKKK